MNVIEITTATLSLKLAASALPDAVVQAMTLDFASRISEASILARAKADAKPPIFYDVLLIHVGDKKIAVIKAIREVTGDGLKEAKDKTEYMGPALIDTFSDSRDAVKAAERLRTEGATITIEPRMVAA